jgi:hypothetical protein
MIKDIREAVNNGLALGSERCKDEIETNLKRRVRPVNIGRPRNMLLTSRNRNVYSDPRYSTLNPTLAPFASANICKAHSRPLQRRFAHAGCRAGSRDEGDRE